MVTVVRTDRLPQVMLLFGIAAVVSAVAAVVSLATYEGVGLIGYRTAGAAAMRVLCFVQTVAGFLLSSTRGRTSRPAVLGFTLALSAYPVAMVAGFATMLIRVALGVE